MKSRIAFAVTLLLCGFAAWMMAGLNPPLGPGGSAYSGAVQTNDAITVLTEAGQTITAMSSVDTTNLTALGTVVFARDVWTNNGTWYHDGWLFYQNGQGFMGKTGHLLLGKEAEYAYSLYGPTAPFSTATTPAARWSNSWLELRNVRFVGQVATSVVSFRADGTLSAGGAVTLESTLGVTGIATLSSNLAVGGVLSIRTNPSPAAVAAYYYLVPGPDTNLLLIASTEHGGGSYSLGGAGGSPGISSVLTTSTNAAGKNIGNVGNLSATNAQFAGTVTSLTNSATFTTYARMYVTNMWAKNVNLNTNTYLSRPPWVAGFKAMYATDNGENGGQLWYQTRSNIWVSLGGLVQTKTNTVALATWQTNLNFSAWLTVGFTLLVGANDTAGIKLVQYKYLYRNDNNGNNGWVTRTNTLGELVVSAALLGTITDSRSVQNIVPRNARWMVITNSAGAGAVSAITTWLDAVP
jgi:hypothetical protein